MHVCFEAKVNHPDGATTDFLALDKCLPNREFMRIMDIETTTSSEAVDRALSIAYDEEWIGILKHAEPFMSKTPGTWYIPADFYKCPGVVPGEKTPWENQPIPMPPSFDLTSARLQTGNFRRRFLIETPESQVQSNPEEIALDL